MAFADGGDETAVIEAFMGLAAWRVRGVGLGQGDHGKSFQATERQSRRHVGQSRPLDADGGTGLAAQISRNPGHDRRRALKMGGDEGNAGFIEGINQGQAGTASRNAEDAGRPPGRYGLGQGLQGTHAGPSRWSIIFVAAWAQTRRTASGEKPPQWGVRIRLSWLSA